MSSAPAKPARFLGVQKGPNGLAAFGVQTATGVEAFAVQPNDAFALAKGLMEAIAPTEDGAAVLGGKGVKMLSQGPQGVVLCFDISGAPLTVGLPPELVSELQGLLTSSPAA